MSRGLTQKEADRLASEGKLNQSPERMTRTYPQIVKGNVFTLFNLINTILLILVLITGQISNALFYLTICANAIIGTLQEFKAKQVMDKMSLLVAAEIEVCRDGKWIVLRSDQLVPGDAIRLKNGMQIPADAVVEEGYLEVNESMLTGESKALIRKQGDLLYAGTIITSGSAECTVLHTGKDNASETIMKDARKYKPARSMLQEELQKILQVITAIIGPVGAALFLTQYFVLHLSWSEAILKTVSALVGMIPEGLVVLTSVALAVSTIRLSRNHVLVQDLYAIESLARVDVLCLDKTGTLTQGTMKVQDVIPLEDADLNHINSIMGSYVRVFSEGNATDKALHDHFAENKLYAEKDILPFSSDRKYAGLVFAGEGSFYLGAANFLFPEGIPSLNHRLEDFAAAGCRVVILAHSVEDTISKDSLPKDLEPVAMITIRDVLRPNAEKIIRYFHDQGVSLKVISGDDPRTVSALAQSAGIDRADRYVDMSQNRHRNMSGLTDFTVFGRVLPEQKKAMVKALQEQGHTVAMIGDGVNDVPALKTADVGIAMAAGSSAAKDSANIVLLTSDFGTMPDIVKEGRRVINNISRASSMYLVKTGFSVLLAVLYTIIGHQEYPFLPIHLSLISTFGVGVPTFILQMEPSFERVKGSFLSKAFRNAFPSSITVFLSAVLVSLLSDVFHMHEARADMIFVLLTCFTYLYTLYKVYYPPTKLRVGVIWTMGALILVSLILFQDVLQVQAEWIDLLIVIPGAILVPVLTAAISRAYDWTASKLKLLKRKR